MTLKSNYLKVKKVPKVVKKVMCEFADEDYKQVGESVSIDLSKF